MVNYIILIRKKNSKKKWTAGVYLLMRSSPILEYSPTMLATCLWLGGITTSVAGLIAIVSNDIKRVIALSTMSQLARKYIYIFMNQTICVEIINIKLIINSQITNALDYFFNQYYYNILNSFPILRQIVLSEQWNIIILSKLVGISEAIRLILVYFETLFIFQSLQFNNNSLLLLTSLNKNSNHNENHNNTKDKKNINKSNLAFDEWIAGVIDGDGYFNLSKKGIARLQITMSDRDIKVLHEIQHIYGGSIKKIANANANRYQLSNRKGLIQLLTNINGLIRNPIRMLQMNKLCVKYGIQLIYPKPLTFKNGWLSGFMDSDGSIYFNEESGQVFISATQKNKYLLEPLIHLYGGRIDILSPKREAFKYVVYRKKELFNLIDNYFSNYPLKSQKQNRLNLIKSFFDLRPYKNSKNIIEFNHWVKFKEKWERFSD